MASLLMGKRRVELGGYLSDSPGVEPPPGSTDRTQGVCGVVGLDGSNGLERGIKRHPATYPYFEYTFIKAYKQCTQKIYHVSTDTAFSARLDCDRLDCTKTGDVIRKNSPSRNSTDRTRGYFSGFPECIHCLAPSNKLTFGGTYKFMPYEYECYTQK